MSLYKLHTPDKRPPMVTNLDRTVPTEQTEAVEQSTEEISDREIQAAMNRELFSRAVEINEVVTEDPGDTTS